MSTIGDPSELVSAASVVPWPLASSVAPADVSAAPLDEPSPTPPEITFSPPDALHASPAIATTPTTKDPRIVQPASQGFVAPSIPRLLYADPSLSWKKFRVERRIDARMGASNGHYRVERHVGRLVEARVFRLSTAEDVDAYIAAIGADVEEVAAGVGGVLVADHRPADIYSPPVSERLVELFQVMNTRLARVAIVTGVEKATFYMQLRRIAREAGYEARQVYQNTPPALEHLAVALSDEELARARAFLDGYP
jgi:hypothetical protein